MFTLCQASLASDVRRKISLFPQLPQPLTSVFSTALWSSNDTTSQLEANNFYKPPSDPRQLFVTEVNGYWLIHFSAPPDIRRTLIPQRETLRRTRITAEGRERRKRSRPIIKAERQLIQCVAGSQSEIDRIQARSSYMESFRHYRVVLKI
jgi:hypothetical protein